jgi:broad specificity phosphatase PhoE
MAAEGREFDVCVVSPLRRTIATAHIALAGRVRRFVVDPESTETAGLRTSFYSTNFC